MRISVTEIESYRYYKASEDMELGDLLKRLRKEEPPSPAMMAGRALHSILEDGIEGDKVERDGYYFKFDADCAVPALPVKELKGQMEFPTSYGPATLVGIVDGLDGGIYDHKLTARFDAERYAASYQWRCYLTMFNARKFTYNVFEGKEQDVNSWVIYGFHQLSYWAYPAMQADVTREVSEFAGFLAKHLPERLLKKAA